MESIEEILNNIKANPEIYNTGRTEEEYIVIDLRKEL